VGTWTILTPAPGLVLQLAATDRGICGLSFVESTLEFLAKMARATGIEEWDRDADPVLAQAAGQLGEYFSARRREFQLPLDLRGTPFRQKVWDALLRIPYGETRSYAELARSIGEPKAVRAVGAANGANPIAIIVPCHRVVSSGGGLGGYGGGVPLKKRLLALESGARS
jgi:methylated-DNA-[protein]-cysteine S-methyltransferase